MHDPVKQRLSEELRIELPAGLYAAISDLKVGEELWFSCPHAAEDNPAREGWIVTEMKRDANQWFVQAPPPDQSLEDCNIRITNGEIKGRRQVWFTAPLSIRWKLYFALSNEIDGQTKRRIIFDEMIQTVYFSSAWFLLALLPVYFTLKFSHRVRDAVVLKTAVDFLPSTKRREILATVEGEVRKAMVERLQKQPDNSM